MMDTQEANLPKEEKILIEETDKMEEPQIPEISPNATTTESDEKLEEVITQTETKAETTATEVNEPVEAPVPLEVTVEDTVAEVTETGEEVVTETDISVEEPVAEINKSEEPQISEISPEASTTESDEKLEEVITQTETNVETTATEVNAQVETPVDIVVEDTVVEPDEKETVTDELEKSSQDEKTTPAQEVQEETTAPLDTAASTLITKSEIIERLKQIVAEPEKYARNEADVLKQTYYKLRHTEVETAKSEFLEEGGEENDFVIPEDETETQLKTLISEYKEKRASITADEERQKEANYILKQHLIERLKVLTESQDDYNKRYNEFREIQRKWKEIRFVPQEHVRELWRNYQIYSDRFYDIIRINNQFREYDFKKNLELKTALCEAVERLGGEPDVFSAFHQLQKLHQQWHDIGPVARDFRDTIWERFKEASSIINKKHQAHFDVLKANEEKNLEKKTAICEEIENINFEALKTIKDWEKKTKGVIALQVKWRKIGFVTKKHSGKIIERFRTACDVYFNKRNEFLNSVEQEMDKNLELKTALVEKAEAMKDRTDWREATKAFIEIQNEWRRIGPVAHKDSAIWKQFIAACDYFFEQKNKEKSSLKSGENDNLEAKKALIEKIRAIDENMTEEDALSTLRGYISDWGNIGFVPFREKDTINKSFHEAVDRQFDRLKVNERDRRLQQFRSNLTERAGVGINKLYNERDKLMRVYERMKNELQTCENNIGFFNISSKGGDGLLKEMDR
ncbi:MAG: DUF349 domain-containing protein, partial [Tannerella sp.]|nr:DUF349 domain-containing protein [Tannerella sp.]